VLDHPLGRRLSSQRQAGAGRLAPFALANQRATPLPAAGIGVRTAAREHMDAKSLTFSFASSGTAEADAAAKRLAQRYGQIPHDQADIVVALGGDGFLLQTLRETMSTGKRVYGMNRGTVGFLMNEYREGALPERLAAAVPETIRPLEMMTVDDTGTSREALAINEVSLLRQSYQAARLRISVDGKVRLDELICDGVMVATPAGSTAYNLSAHGPILPLDAPLLALTPVSPFRPRRWRGALLPKTAVVRFDILEEQKRPVNAVADHTEVKSVVSVEVRESAVHTATLLFDPGHSWSERILAEQFKY
jgi:NAD+ kinase